MAAGGADAEPNTPTLSMAEQNLGSAAARLALTWPEHLEHLGRVTTHYRFDVVLYKFCYGWAPQQQTSLFVWTGML